jgi:hypothetical protein
MTVVLRQPSGWYGPDELRMAAEYAEVPGHPGKMYTDCVSIQSGGPKGGRNRRRLFLPVI